MTQAAAPHPTQPFLTLAEYLDYDDGTDIRYELENGELHVIPTESDLNNLIVMFLIAQFFQSVPFSRLRRGTEIAVTGYRATARAPDLMVLTEESAVALEGTSRSILMPEMPPPALVVEVVSPGTENERRDYRYKRSEYAARGIREYWIVDPVAQQVVVLTWVEGLYEEVILKGDQPLVSTLFPDLHLTATQVLQAKQK